MTEPKPGNKEQKKVTPEEFEFEEIVCNADFSSGCIEPGDE